MKIIDVRSKDEYDNGHIDGAENIDVMDIMNGKLPDCSKDTPIILYCISGGRADRAKNILESVGFLNVENGGGLRDMKARTF